MGVVRKSPGARRPAPMHFPIILCILCILASMFNNPGNRDYNSFSTSRPGPDSTAWRHNLGQPDRQVHTAPCKESFKFPYGSPNGASDGCPAHSQSPPGLP